MTTINLTPLLQLVISVCAGLVTRYVIPWIQEKAGRERTEKLYRLASIGVRAAEQLYGAGTGREKAEYVRRFLSDRGFTVSADEIRAAIEAAVYEMNNEITEPVEDNT